jgi:hypothetical protein
VKMAVRSGMLPSLTMICIPCMDCGERATCWEHRDYARPLDVQPTCHSCNLLRGHAAHPDYVYTTSPKKSYGKKVAVQTKRKRP